MTAQPEPAYGEDRWPSLAAVNTVVSGSSGLDRVPDPAAFISWLAALGVEAHLPDPHSTGKAALESWERFVAFRRDARVLLAAREVAQPLPAAPLGRVNAASGAVRPALTGDGALSLRPAAGVPVIGVFAVDLIRLIASEEGGRVRTCAAEDCDRMFVQDHGRRIWCSARCGARIRGRRRSARTRLDTVTTRGAR